MKRKSLNGHRSSELINPEKQRKALRWLSEGDRANLVLVLPTEPLPVVEPKNINAGTKSIMRLVKSYDPEYHPRVAGQMVLNGALERDIITALGITEKVFSLWQGMHPEFAAVLQITDDMSLANARVERSIYEMANGYERDTVKFFQNEGEVIEVKYKEHVPRDMKAAAFWLRNRDPQRWGRDEKGDSGKGGNTTLNIKMIQGMDTEQLRAIHKFLKGAVSGANTGLKRLDKPVVDAEVVEVEVDENSEAAPSGTD